MNPSLGYARREAPPGGREPGINPADWWAEPLTVVSPGPPSSSPKPHLAGRVVDRIIRWWYKVSMRMSSTIKTSVWLSLAVFILLAGACPASQPTLEDFWNHTAQFQADAFGVGSSFGFHFPSMMWEGSEIWAYYIKNIQGMSGVGRARSTDGINWTDDGAVLNVSGAWQWTWQAEGVSILHSIGRSYSDGWTANTGQDMPGYMCYGPNTTQIPGGLNNAIFRIMIDIVAAPNDKVVTLDVYDNTSGTVLASVDVYRSEWVANSTYKDFRLNFTSTAGHELQFRVYWHRTSYVRVDAIGVAQGVGPYYDDRFASFPGIWKDNGTYYLVYEGAGTSASWPGDVCLATSLDGLNFTKHPSNPILRHNASGWESANIGTPSLHRVGSTWYLMYHGFNGTDCQVGIATGTNLTSLTKHGNPVIPTSSTGWDNGTVGRRSQLIKVGSYYYMAYEGSTDKVNGEFRYSNWSTGLARSANLITWTKCSDNPVIPVIVGGMGNDGPEMVVIGDITYLYVRSYPTTRYKLIWNPTIPNPPSGPGSTSVTRTSIRWTWQDNSSDETGFKVYYDPGTGPPVTLLATTAADAVYRDKTSLTGNTSYSFQVLATNTAGDSDRTSNYCKVTLANSPSAGNNMTCAKLRNTPYPLGAVFEFSNPVGFGQGTHGGSQYRVSGFRYAWDKSSTYTWTGSEAVWDSGTLALSPNLGDGSYYLHLQSYNAESVANPTTLNYGPYVVIPEDGSIAAAKALGNNLSVTLGGKLLYFRNGGYGYIEEPDRSCGIRIEGSLAGQQDELVYLTGVKKTSLAGEAYIQVSAMSSDVQAIIRPIAVVSQRSLASRVVDGMYVRVCGMVKPDSVSGNSYVLLDGTDSTGLKIVTKTAPQVTDGEFVVVDGAAGFDGARVVYQR